MRAHQRRAWDECRLRQGVGAVLIASPSVIRWLSGMTGSGHYTPQLLLLGPDSCAAIVRPMDAAALPPGSVDAVYCYRDDAVDSPDDHPIAQTVVPLLQGLGRVGIDADSVYFRARYLVELQAAGIETVDCTRALAMARLQKTTAELALISRAAAHADDVMAAGVSAAHQTVRRADVAAAMQAVQTRAGELPAMQSMINQTGHGAHENWDDQALLPHDTVRIETCGVAGGYHVPISRTVLLPGCSEDVLKAAWWQHAVLELAIDAGVSALRAGVRCCDVHAVMAPILERAGMRKASRLGYSFGMGMAPDWGEGSVSIRESCTDVLPPGACIHLILGCGDGWLVQLSAACVVGPEGGVRLCRTPSTLLVGGAPSAMASLPPPDAIAEAVAREVAPPPEPAAEPAAEPADRRVGLLIGTPRRKPDAMALVALLAARPPTKSDPTPVLTSRPLAHVMGLPPGSRITLKDETARLGGRSFKMLGVTAAVDALGPIPETTTLCTASDGNHGHALQEVARRIGRRAEVWLPRDVGSAARQRLDHAVVHEVDGTYDDAVAAALAACADDPGRLLISDQAVEGYTDVPKTIAAGYLTLFREIEQQSERFSHVFVQAGVGGLASACATWILSSQWFMDHPPPMLVVVEAIGSACYAQSIKAGRMTSVDATATACEGLCCGTPSCVAYPIVLSAASAYVSMGDMYAEVAQRVLERFVPTGPSGAAGLAGLAAVLSVEGAAETMRLDRPAHVLCIVTEAPF